MKDHLICCPLCGTEIPFDSTQCGYCGALLAAGPSRSTPILKGVVCPQCKTKNYSYDECHSCGRVFTITCPSCQTEMKLTDQSCPHCGMSLRRINSTRRKAERVAARVGKTARERIKDKWTFIVPISLAVLMIAIAGVYSLWFAAPAKSQAPRAGKAQAVDLNNDGKTDRWDIYGPGGWVTERRYDENNDGIVEKIELLDEQGMVRYATLDENADRRIEQYQVYAPNGKLRSAYFYGDDREHRPIKIETYNHQGVLMERWVDTDEDFLFNTYSRFDPKGRLMLEAADTKNNGYFDLILLYRGNKQIYERQYDADGDGIIEKIESLNSGGARIALTEDLNADGLIDKKTFYQTSGAVRWVQIDANKDGVFDTFESYSQTGQVARTGTDTNNDGAPDQWQ